MMIQNHKTQTEPRSYSVVHSALKSEALRSEAGREDSVVSVASYVRGVYKDTEPAHLVVLLGL